MMMGVTRRRYVRAGLLVALLVPACPAWAQQGSGATVPPTQAARRTAAERRAGARHASRHGARVHERRSKWQRRNQSAVLDTGLTAAAAELARKLYVVLDSRLPARLNDLSDLPGDAR